MKSNYIFLLGCWIMIMSVFAGRKKIGSIKPELVKNGFQEHELGYLNLANAVSSAIGSLVLGYLSKNIKPRNILIGCAISLSCTLFSMSFLRSVPAIVGMSSLLGLSTCLLQPTMNALVK